MPTLGVKPVTGSAFTQARYKIKPDFFNDLCQLVACSYKRSHKKLWKGHLLLAGDGSTLNLPHSSDIKEYFGIHSTNSLGVNRYLARVFFLYDVLNDFVVGYSLSKMEQGEKTLLSKCLVTLESTNHILTLDRGFGNFTTLKELSCKQANFCVRLSVKNSRFAKSIMQDEHNDFITDWVPSSRERENSKKNGLDCQPLKVRVTKILLGTGEIELLVSSLLNTETYTTVDLSQLYNLRWGVEEGFKNLKPKMGIEQFGCKKTAGVFQEFYAHIFYLNMVGMAGMATSKNIEEKTVHRKWKYRYNWKNAYRFLRTVMVRLLNLKEIDELLDKLLIKISGSLVAIIPERKFARNTGNRSQKTRITSFYK